MDFGNLLACSTCTSTTIPPLGTFLEHVPRSVPLILPYLSNLDHLANISLAGYLLLFSLWFFTVNSDCTSQEDLLLLLRTLLRVLHKTLRLIYNTGARNLLFDTFLRDNNTYL